MARSLLDEPSRQGPGVFWFISAASLLLLALVPLVVGWLGTADGLDLGHVLGTLVVLALGAAAGAILWMRDRARQQGDSGLRLYADMLRSVDLAVAITDMNGRVLFCNEAIETIGGCAPEELIGEMWFQALGPDFDEGLASDVLRQTLGGGWRGQVHPESGQSPRCVEVVGSVVRDEHQRPTALAWTFEDFTDHDHRMQHLARLAAVAEHSPDAIVCTDMDGQITSWNHGAERLFGFIGENILGRNIDVLIPDDLKDSYHDAMKARMFEKGLIESIETVRLHADGTHIPVHLAVANIPDDSGRIVGRAVVLHDITKRRELEQQLRQYALGLQDQLKHAERRVTAVERAWQQLLPHVTSFVVLASGEGKVQEVSPNVTQQLGYAQKELDVMKLTDFHDRTHARYVNDMIGTARHNGTARGSVQLTDRHSQHIETELDITYFPETNTYQAIYRVLES